MLISGRKATRVAESDNDYPEKAYDCHGAVCGRIFTCDGAKRSPDRWLSAGDGRRGRQSRSTRTGLLSRRKTKLRYLCKWVSSSDQTPQKDLHVSKATAVERYKGGLLPARQSTARAAITKGRSRWKNLGDQVVILYVGDVLHDKNDHNMWSAQRL